MKQGQELYIIFKHCKIQITISNILFFIFLLYLKVFDAYAQFEESMLKAKMETSAESGSTEDGKPDSLLW